MSCDPPDDLHPSEGIPTPTLISVVVRSMDRPSLGAALDSIATQTYRRVEVLVVNALGSMHSPLPARCGDFELRLVNGDGPGLARAAAANAGLDAATGEWLIFLDDDDQFFPDHLQRLANALVNEPNAVAAYSDVDYGHMTPQGWVSSHCFAAEFDAYRLGFENFLPIHAVLFRRHRASAAACRFDLQFALFEDWDFWLQLSGRGPFVHVPGISARYFTTGSGASGVFAPSQEAALARTQLLAKWSARRSSSDHVRLLDIAQSYYRSANEGKDREAAMARELSDSLKLLAARDGEIAEYQRHVSGLKARLDARDKELSGATAHTAGLDSVIAARDAELKAYAVIAADLRQTLAARDAELKAYADLAVELRQTLAARDAELKAYANLAAELRQTLAARDAELKAYTDLAADLRQTLAARQAELSAYAVNTADLDRTLAARDAEIAAINAELTRLRTQGPFSAFARALRTQPLDDHR